MTRQRVEAIRNVALEELHECWQKAREAPDDIGICGDAWQFTDGLHLAACRQLESMTRQPNQAGVEVHPLDLAILYLAQAAMDNQASRTEIGFLIDEVRQLPRKGGGA